MTVQEFKLKHPELAHLEGDQLWNAMEDSMLERTKQMVKDLVIKDWKGNLVKEGDEICFIRTKIVHGRYGMLWPQTGETTWMEQEPDEDVWLLSSYLRVGLGFLVTQVIGNCTIQQHLGSLILMNGQPNVILAIKGVSDTKPT